MSLPRGVVSNLLGLSFTSVLVSEQISQLIGSFVAILSADFLEVPQLFRFRNTRRGASFSTTGGVNTARSTVVTRTQFFGLFGEPSAINYLMPNGESKHVEILGLAGHCDRAGPFKEWAYQGVEGFRLRCGLGRISSNTICSEWPLQIKPPHNPAQPWP